MSNELCLIMYNSLDINICLMNCGGKLYFFGQKPFWTLLTYCENEFVYFPFFLSVEYIGGNLPRYS